MLAGSDSRTRPARSGLAFFLALSLSLWVCAAVHPEDRSGQLGAKLDHLEGLEARPEVVFLGSSRVLRGFVPVVFDEELAAVGIPLRSYNLGAEGMRLPEFVHALEQLAEMPDHGIEWVLLDPEEADLRLLRERNPRASRVLAWHDLERTLQLTELVHDWPELDAAARLDLTLDHLEAFVHRTTGIGSFGPWTRSILGTNPTWAEAFLGPKEDGYVPHLGHAPEGAPARMPEAERAWAWRVAAKSRSRVTTEELHPVALALYGDLVRATERLGARLILVTLPGLTPRDDTIRAARALRVPLMRFDRPDLDPELYRMEDRYDRYHLNHSGAVAFTRALAERFASAHSRLRAHAAGD